MKLSEMSNSKEQRQRNQQAQNEDIAKKYDELKNHSSYELMNMLEKEVQSQKQKGVFDYDGLLSSIEKMKDYLPPATYQNMVEVIKNLK
ncbi:MAG: hypothetical protein J6J24_05125 [Clostridia bacterium]|nr:hypothetical protein [Clostridia bacterium]